MQTAVCADPANKNPGGGIHLYTKQARRKLDQIARAITFQMAERRTAAGNPVAADGYSGSTKKRR